MKKNLSDYIVALAVIACSAILLAALTIALSGWRGNSRGRYQDIDYPDVTGLHIHSEVRYAGAPAGSIAAIRLLTFEERIKSGDHKANAVRVTIELLPSVPALPEDVKASIGSDTLLSDKFVALTAGSPDVPALVAGIVIQGSSSGGIDGLANKLGPLADSLEPMLQHVVQNVDVLLGQVGPVLRKTNDAVDTLKNGMGDALPRISKLADDLKLTSASAAAALKRVDGLIGDVDEPVKSDLKEIKNTLVQLDQTLGVADRFIAHTDKSLEGRLDELSVVLQNLKVISTHTKALTKALGEKPNRLIFSGKPQKLTPEEEILRSSKPLPAAPAALPTVAPVGGQH